MKIYIEHKIKGIEDLPKEKERFYLFHHIYSAKFAIVEYCPKSDDIVIEPAFYIDYYDIWLEPVEISDGAEEILAISAGAPDDYGDGFKLLYTQEQVLKAMKEYAAQEVAKALVTETKVPQGWECPRCHKIYSWMVEHCNCPPQTITAATCSNNIQPTDQEIEEWADNRLRPENDPIDKAFHSGLIAGAKAALNGEIKKGI